MAYSDFTLEKVKQNFQINTIERTDIFANTTDIECSELLKEVLQYNVPIAIASNSEKARSEMIISPILLDLRRQLNDQINLFSGVEFNGSKDGNLLICCHDYKLSGNTSPQPS